MFRGQGAKENMWSCDGGKYAAVDVTANVFRRTTYTSLWRVCCLDKADVL